MFSESHNPDRVIFNFSSYELTDDEKYLLCIHLHFAVKPGLIYYLLSYYFATALTSYKNFSSDRDPPENLTFRI